MCFQAFTRAVNDYTKSKGITGEEFNISEDGDETFMIEDDSEESDDSDDNSGMKFTNSA